MFPQGSDLMNCEMSMANIARNFQIEYVCFEHEFAFVMHTSTSYQRDGQDGAIFSRALRGLKSTGACVQFTANPLASLVFSMSL